MKRILVRGATSIITHIFVQDSASTTGAGKAGLTSASAGLPSKERRCASRASTIARLTSSPVDSPRRR